MGDELDRHFVHTPFEPALGDEAVAEARARQIVRQPQPDAAGNHHRICTLREGQVAGDRAKAQAEPVERGRSETIAARQSRCSQLLLVVDRDVEILDRRECFVEIGESLPGDHPFNRDPTEIPAELHEDLVLKTVERREIDVAALGLDYLVMIGLAKERGDAEPGAGAAVDLGQCEAGVGAADVGDCDLPHACSVSIAASIADAPASASLACMRIIANSSRPVPAGGGGELAAGRDARSTPTASSVPLRASSRMTSPSRTRASGPSGSASGET